MSLFAIHILSLQGLGDALNSGPCSPLERAGGTVSPSCGYVRSLPSEELEQESQ